MAIDYSDSGRTIKYYNGYSARMLNDVNGIIAQAREDLKGVKYDTLVGRGTSGMLIIPMVARALRKNYFIVRKPEEAQSAHSGIDFLGTLGRRWIFFDDFVSSGETFYRTRVGVNNAVSQANRVPREFWDGKRWVSQKREPFATELVGLFEYTDRGHGWSPWGAHLRDRDWADKWTGDLPWTVTED